MADAKVSALTEVSVPDLSDAVYLVDNTGPTSYKVSLPRLLGLLHRGACEGRLTLETGVPVSTTDQIGKSTLYWTPIDQGRVTLYDGTRWVMFHLAEVSLALTGLTTATNYDVFLDYNAGTPALVLGPAWTDATTRATGLTTQDGIKCLTGTLTKRWVGTIRTTSTTTTTDSGGYTGTTQVGGARFVWNAYNQVRRALRVIDLTDSWSYTTNTVRQANGATGNKVEYVTGDAAVAVEAEVLCQINGFANTGSLTTAVGVGVDSTTVMSGLHPGGHNPSGSTGIYLPLAARYVGQPGLGYHALNWLEIGASGTTTFYGDAGIASVQSGLIATVVG